ncbi:MAG: DivIVA domain-containing protein, partial [Clostridiales bacterium]|nr:DivIVA domain-containing protein [Clostridiales bacterium]
MQAKNAKVKLPFNIDNKGYNKTQVDEYLDLISGEFSNLNTGYQYLGSKYTKLRLENEQLEAEIRRLKANSASADASHIGQALIDARKIAAQITNQAKQEADLIIRNANEQANIAEAKKSESIRLIEQMQQQIQDIILGIGGAEANNKNTDNKPLIVTEEIALPGETVLPEEIVVPEKFAIPADPVPASPQMNGTKPKRKRSALRVASSILFYVAIIGAVFLAFVASGKTGDAPRNILGYSYFTVLSGSMQKEIPVGSLVITRKIDPDKLQIGDNITFMKSSNTSVTHKIIGIYENYN